MTVRVDDFNRQKDCIYKNEHYSVRDNGAVFRHSRKNKRLRKLDDKWTFGNPNNNGYMLIASEVVHRIVAYAFLGPPPNNKYVVDHIDTNRQNNRPENLRWLTKLENILKNPITVKKIIFLCGSIESFLKDPSILKNHVNEDRNFEWMRTVSSEEARISWERLSSWANKKDSNISSKRGSLGEWIFSQNYSMKKTDQERILQEKVNPTRINKLIEEVLQRVEKESGIKREEFSSKSKKEKYLHARVYAAYLLRLEADLSEETIAKIIGRSKSMVNTYLNYPENYLRNVDYYRKNVGLL